MATVSVPLLAIAGGTRAFNAPDASAELAAEDVGVELALDALPVLPPPPPLLLLLAHPVSASETVATRDRAMPNGRMRDDKIDLLRIE
ncbi:MAG: hypothetical protein M3Y06_07820 [Actinomycetota bacterium]|nr:hypothetical protein [Actinomycetota bacterium]